MKKVGRFALALLGLLVVCCLNEAKVQAQDLAAVLQMDKNQPGPPQAGYKPLGAVLEELKSRKGIYFNGKSMKDKLADSRFNAADKAEDILTALPKPVGLTYKKVGEIFVILDENEKEVRKEVKKKLGELTTDTTAYPGAPSPAPASVTAASAVALTVTGKVTGNAGQSLPGVNVLLKGTTNGTATDANGNYSLTLPDGDGTLVFSYIGYTTEEAAIRPTLFKP